ncbi:MAG: ABC transporter substrate-binding protein [Spirochaetota bacterium]
MRKFFIILIVLCIMPLAIFPAGQGEAVTTPGVTDTEILVGYSMPMSGPIGFIGNQTADATRAVFNKANDEGGIYGRKLKLITYDSGMDVAQAVANYKKLIFEDKAFCVLFGFGSYVRPGYPLFEENMVPWLFPMAPPEDTMFPARKYLFSVFPTTATQMRTITKWLIQQDKWHKIGAIYGDSASGKTGFDRLKKELEGSSIQIVAAEALLETSPSAAVQVAKIKQADPDLALVFGMTMQPAAVAIKEIKRVGMTVPIMVNQPITNSVLLDLLKDENIEGLMGSYWGKIQYMTGYENEATPEMRAIAQTIVKYFPDYGKLGSNIGGLVEHGLSVQLFVEALKKTGKNLTREGLIKTLETSISNYPSGKGSLVTFSPKRHEGVAGGIIAQVKNGWWRPVSDWIEVELEE